MNRRTRVLQLAVLGALQFPAIAFANTIWQHDPATSGDWFTLANWTSGLPGTANPAEINNAGTVTIASGNAATNVLYLGKNLGDSGILSLTGGVLTLSSTSAYIGLAGSGTINQSGGTFTASNFGSLSLGYNPTATGVYNLSNGRLSVSDLTLSNFGTATFNQTGGTFTGSSFLYIGGIYPTGTGSYNLIAGQVTFSSTENIGFIGAGTFTQSGGTHTANSTVNIGGPNGGLYSLSNGVYIVNGNEVIGGTSTGTFTQTGGTHSITSTRQLILGLGSGVSASYSLSNGVLFVGGAETIGNIGTASFNQASGTHSAASIAVGAGSTLSVTGGSVTFTGGLANLGSMTLGTNTTSLSGGGLIDLGHATLINPSSTSITITAANSMIILPAGVTTASFASFTNAVGAIVANAGSPITIPAGVTVAAGIGSSRDLITVNGTLSGSAALYGGITLSSAAASASVRYLRLDNSSGGISGGSLSVTSNESIGYNGAATFTQSGGTHSVTASNNFALGANAGSSGKYFLSNGTLSVAGIEAIGSAGSGTFSQSGGTNVCTSVQVGANSLYNMTGGSLQFTAGLTNNGAIILGGTANVTAGGLIDLSRANLSSVGGVNFSAGIGGSLVILPPGTNTANFASFTGTVVFGQAPITINGIVATGTGGALDFVTVNGTVTGAGVFTGGMTVQGAGSATLATLRTDNVISSISSGQLTATSVEYVGYNNGGTFNQTGGVHSFSSSGLRIAFNPGSTGVYNLSNGNLNGGSDFVGYSGDGIFNQSGGTHSLAFSVATLTLGNNPGSSGRYFLTNGVLNTGRTIVGESGNATFTQSGGTHTIVSNLYVANQLGSTGKYDLSAGILSTPGSEWIGVYGGGTFLQSGGSNTTADLYLAALGNASSGTYSLSSTGALTAANIYMGGTVVLPGGTGALVISGGTANISTLIELRSATSHIDITAGSLAAPRLDIYAGSVTHSAGTLNIPIVTNAGNLRLDAAANIVSLTLNGGTLSGHGSITGSVLPGTAAHTIAPSASLAATSVNALTLGSLTTSALTTLAFNLVTPASSDALVISSSNGLTLNGGSIQLTDNNAPQGYYKLIQYTGTIQGAGAASLSILTSPPNSKIAYILDPFHDPGYVEIHKVLIGDANGDNIVDGADFDTWFTNLQISTHNFAQGDLNNDGLVDGADFDLWFTHLQNTFGSSNLEFQMSDFQSPIPNPSPVPEPASLFILVPLAALFTRRHKFR